MTQPTSSTPNENKPAGNDPMNSVVSLLRRDENISRLFVIMIVIFVIMSIARPAVFPTLQNFQSMAFQFSEIGIMALGIMLTLITGGIDLSVNATANLAGITAGLILTKLAPAGSNPSTVTGVIILAIVAALFVGLICGLLNGFLITRVGIYPILATLGTMTLFSGLTIGITKGTGIFGIPEFQFLGNGEFLKIPVPFIIFIVLAIIISIVLSRSTLGIRLYLIGTNPVASKFSGIDNRNVLMKVYALSGVLSALAGIVILARTNSANADYGSSYVLMAILIAVLGGVDPNGGFGKISGLLLGIFSLQFLSTGLNMLLAEYRGANFFKEFSWGLLLIAIMVVNFLSAQRKTKVKTKPAA
jgi:simple sugar transport system permease protein